MGARGSGQPRGLTVGEALRITSPWFWLCFAGALVVVTPLSRGAHRRLALALVNLGFVAALTRGSVGLVLLGLVLSYAVARVADRSGRRARGVVLLGAAAALALFVVHKLPWIATGLYLTGMSRVLALVGFSYVLLRFLDELRHVAENGGAPGFLDHVNYLLPFHMLAAGPIASFAEHAAQPDVPQPLTRDDVLGAVERIVFGLVKKLVLAHLLERLFLTGFTAGGGYWVFEMQVFFLWLYLDFSAYSDIAVGIGRLLGVATPENFNRPYLARNMIEFWDRWHISLSRWVRRNLFIPVQLWLLRRDPGRSPLVAASLAFSVAFLLCGLWHAISLRYLGWGAMHAGGLVVTNAYRELLLRRLGRAGLATHLKRPGPRVMATLLTYQYNALSLMLIAS